MLRKLIPLLSLLNGFSNAHKMQFGEEDAGLDQKWGQDWGFSGISTFANLPHVKCLTHPDSAFDIGVIGAPFDTAVTYRPGARFGPRAIRAGSARQNAGLGFNARAGVNPYLSWATIIDCGDIPVSPFDNVLALRQMSEAFDELALRKPPSKSRDLFEKSKQSKLLTLGGDHSIVLPALRALKKAHDQPIAVVHFDAHLDTWNPVRYPSSWTPNADKDTPSSFNHGSMFWIAAQEGLIANGSSVHAGLRTRLGGVDFSDYDSDTKQGWIQISTDDIDDIGVKGIVQSIMDRVGTEVPTYLSIDIDVIDPGLAPATGTPEPGGWTTRELIRILRGIEGLNLVGADIVEVSPAYDTSAEQTAQAAAQIVYEVLTSMVKRGLVDMGKTDQKRTSDARGDGKHEL